ncbi:MAG: NAD-dependent protein deacylase [Gammaproteobacteria bacterium]|nr:NAD-dependent protein deacylase [Gammaproteobacteria bacterium]
MSPVYHNILVLTGAGISAESGISTFRDNGGLWERHRLEDVATPEAFARDPALVHNFYNQRRARLCNDLIEPNPAHRALAEFEQKSPARFQLVTQNIDDLHEQAGSSAVIHMHGELKKVRCRRSDHIFQWNSDLTTETPCPCCGTGGNLRPHVVWFGEMPLAMERIQAALMLADLFIAIGTSGLVYPAAGFVDMANQAGAHTIELNLAPSSGESLFKEHRYGPASQVVPEFFSELLLP